MKETSRILRGSVATLCGLTTFVCASMGFARDGSWATKAPMPTAEMGQALGVMNGQLFVIDGDPSVNNVYNPTTNTWTRKTPSPTPRTYATARVVNGKLYVAGGCVNNDCRIGTTNIVEMYNPATDTWTTKAPMPTARFGAGSAVSSNGQMYVVGGGSACPPCLPQFATLEVYDPTTNTWTTKAPMPTAREGLGATSINGKLYVMGGVVRPANVATNVLEVYDPATNTWTAKAPMPTARSSLQVAVINGEIHVVGGEANGALLSTHEVYAPATNTWTTDAPLPTARTRLASGIGVINGRLYVPGGVVCGLNGCSPSRGLEVYSPPPLIGGSVTGISAASVECTNLTTTQSVSISLGGKTSWNCETAGLIVNAGDNIEQQVQGAAYPGCLGSTNPRLPVAFCSSAINYPTNCNVANGVLAPNVNGGFFAPAPFGNLTAAMCVNLVDGITTMPTISTGTSINFNNGQLSSCLLAIQTQYNANKDASGKWCVAVPVVDTCNLSSSQPVAGFATFCITEVNTTSSPKYVQGFLQCPSSWPGGSGGECFGTAATH